MISTQDSGLDATASKPLSLMQLAESFDSRLARIERMLEALIESLAVEEDGERDQTQSL